MKQKMTFQKSSERCVIFSEFFAVHGWGGDALTVNCPVKLENDFCMFLIVMYKCLKDPLPPRFVAR